MKYAREFALIFTPVAFAWTLSYLLGAFVSASWNIAEWTGDARVLCAIWGSTFGGAIWYRLQVEV